MRPFRCFIIVLLVASFCCTLWGRAEDLKTPQQTLRLVSYNIKHGRGMDGKVDLARTARVLSGLKPDLVALQEVDKKCIRSGRVDIAADLGRRLKMHHCFGKFMDYQGGEYGMAVLSRFPILRMVRHELPAGAEPRCALAVAVKCPQSAKPVTFVCIHNDWTKESLRVSQVSALLKALKSTKTPVVLAGDFNGERTDASLRMLAKAGWLILEKHGGGKKTWPSVKPKVEIDFFALRGFKNIAATCRVVAEAEASDHRPVYGEIIFRPKNN